MIKTNLLQRVLVAPSKQMNRLSIISGYASSGFAKRNLEEVRLPDGSIPCRIELVVGMASQDGINIRHHTNFQVLIDAYSKNFSCRYVTSKPPIHSKLYIWSRDQRPVLAWAGSANYTHAGFTDTIQGNILSEADPVSAMSYFQGIRRKAEDCRTVDTTSQVKIYRRKDEYEDMSEFQSRKLPLVGRNGEVPSRSGLNWGQRPDRDPNQAYIPVPSSIARSGFFPPRSEKFTMETDDGKFFICCIAQDNDKAIHTTYDNSELGRYFRERLSVPGGELVTKRHMREYGRDHVIISKISHDHYFLDFSPNRK